jgi:Winged helix DNA-binding domain
MVPLVQVTPRGLWGRSGQATWATIEDWLGRPLEPEPSLDQLVLRYLAAFGPATAMDAQAWCGLTRLREVTDRLRPRLRTFRSEDGRELLDLPDAPLPDPDTPAPVRFLPHWDAVLLVHARRTGLLPEAYRSRVFGIRNPFSVGTYLVDGRVVGAWSVRDGRVVLDPFEDLSPADRRAVEHEREALEAFHR